MTRTKIILVSLLALTAVGIVGGIGYVIFRTFNESSPGTVIVTAAPDDSVPPSIEGGLEIIDVPALIDSTSTEIEDPDEDPSELPPEYLRKVYVYTEGSRGLPGEATGVYAYDLAAPKTVAPAPVQGEIIIPQTSAGTGGGSAVPSSIEGSADPDGDGLTNDQELQQGTEPNKADTDGDGVNDGDEIRRYRTDPRVGDTDGDELSDGQEVNTYTTDPLNPDSDGDTFYDGAEVKAGYNPKGPGKL